MIGYVATGRITQAHPRFVGSGSSRPALDVTAAQSLADPDSDAVPHSRPLDERLAERWAQIRDEWAQVTFFLFDPNSWR